MKIACLTTFLRKINFVPLFNTQNDNFSILRACSHYDVIVTSYVNGWFLFWYQWKEDVHSCTLVVNLGLFSIDNPEKIYLENPQENKG